MKDRNESTRVRITKTAVDALKVNERIIDDKISGFMARRLPSGTAAYGFRYRLKGRDQRWISLGEHGKITADQARKRATQLRAMVNLNRDPVAEDQAQRDVEDHAKRVKKNTVNAVLDRFVVEHVNEKRLRTAKEIERLLEMHVRPYVGAVPVYQLTRDDLNAMVRTVKKAAGARSSARALASLRSALNWYSIEDSKFISPVVRGMGGPPAKARDRTLNDSEIQSLWKALDSSEIVDEFSKIVRVLLLTGQRRSDVSDMHSDEIDVDTWIIPASRYKNGDTQFVHLTAQARSWIPDTKGFVYGARTGGKRPYSGFSKSKAMLDKVIARERKQAGLPAMPPWRLHDLRRTARSLLSRAKVPSDIAEIVLGHRLQGVRAVYDRYSYADERKDALERLAALLDSIISPRSAKVITLGIAMAEKTAADFLSVLIGKMISFLEVPSKLPAKEFSAPAGAENDVAVEGSKTGKKKGRMAACWLLKVRTRLPGNFIGAPSSKSWSS